MAFIDDIQSRDTALFPIVRIPSVSYYISIKPFSIKNYVSDSDTKNYIPLLLSSPSIKESIDLESRKYKISNVSLKISNVEYNGVRFSDSQIPLNTKESIWWVSPSCESVFEDSYMAYAGTVRAITHDEKTCNITLEDISQSILHRDVPVELLGTDDKILEKYRNKPIPMVYGEVDKSPCVVPEIYGDTLLDFNIIPDRVFDTNLAIEGIQRFTDINWDGGESGVSDFMVVSDDAYCHVLQTPLYADGLSVSKQYNLGAPEVDGTEEFNAKYIITNPENVYMVDDPNTPDVDEGSATFGGDPNTIAENIVQIYEVDNKINNVNHIDISDYPVIPNTNILLVVNPMPGVSWEDEDWWFTNMVESSVNPYYDVFRIGQVLLTFNSAESIDDYPKREALSFGANSKLTATVPLLGGANPFFELRCWVGYGDPANATRMLTWDEDIDIDGINWEATHSINEDNLLATTNTKKYISESFEGFGDEASIWRVAIQNSMTYAVGSGSIISTFQNSIAALKVYYLDKFATRDFYVHVKGRTSP